MDRFAGVNTKRLFAGSCFGIGASAMTFVAISAVMGPLKEHFVLTNEQVGRIGGAAMWGFTVTILTFGSLCDVKSTMRDRAKQAVDAHYGNTDCAVYNDFRELLARGDVDAVSIATLDSWHVVHALASVRAGKDLYVEKPLGMSIHQIKVLRDAVHRYDRVFQLGTQQRSSPEFRQACEIARNGRLGRVHTIKVGVHAGAAERSGLRTYAPESVPDWLEYDLWIGPAPWAPYTTARLVYPHWFHNSDYSLGYVSGWGIHHIDIAQWGGGTELTGPVEVEGSAKFPYDDALCDNPISWDTRMKYANGVDLIFTGDGPGFTGVRHGITFEGTDGWVWVNRGAIEAEPKSLLEAPFGPDDVRLPVSNFHQGNFLECVRSRKKTISNIDVAVRSDTVCQLAWCAFQLGRKLHWDPREEVFVNDPDANQRLTRPLRAPWRL